MREAWLTDFMFDCFLKIQLYQFLYYMYILKRTLVKILLSQFNIDLSDILNI